MKLRSQLFTALALILLSWNASAQGRVRTETSRTDQRFQYGSMERTKLLQQARGGRSGSEDVLKLGAVDRRTLLTTGKSVYKKKPERRYRR